MGSSRHLKSAVGKKKKKERKKEKNKWRKEGKDVL